MYRISAMEKDRQLIKSRVQLEAPRNSLILLSGLTLPFFRANCVDVDEKGALWPLAGFCLRALRHIEVTGRYVLMGIWKAFATDAMIGERCMMADCLCLT